MRDVNEAITRLNARLVLAGAIGDALDAAAGDGFAPPWVHVYREQVEAIREAAEAVEQATNALARGVGGIAPDGDSHAHAGAAGQPRGTHVPPAGTSSRPGQPACVQTPLSAAHE